MPTPAHRLDRQLGRSLGRAVGEQEVVGLSGGGGVRPGRCPGPPARPQQCLNFARCRTGTGRPGDAVGGHEHGHQ